MRRVLLFVNPLLMQSRSRRVVAERAAQLLREDGCQVAMQDSLSAHSCQEQAHEAVAAGFDTIFVCGGDGTIFQVLQGIAGSDIALGILPCGTGNVLAQNLRLPRDPLAALRAQKNGPPVSIPLGKVICKVPGHLTERQWYFTFAAGLGAHAALMNLAPTGAGKRVGGRAAYYAGGLRLLMSHPIQPFEAEITSVDGKKTRSSVSELLAVRVPEINRWRPGGDLCSDKLQIAMVPQSSRLGLAHACFHAIVTRRSEGPSRLPYPQYQEAVHVECRPLAGFAYRLPLLVEADGEVIGMEHATFTIAQQRLRLLWPPR